MVQVLKQQKRAKERHNREGDVGKLQNSLTCEKIQDSGLFVYCLWASSMREGEVKIAI